MSYLQLSNLWNYFLFFYHFTIIFVYLFSIFLYLLLSIFVSVNNVSYSFSFYWSNKPKNWSPKIYKLQQKPQTNAQLKRLFSTQLVDLNSWSKSVGDKFIDLVIIANLLTNSWKGLILKLFLLQTLSTMRIASSKWIILHAWMHATFIKWWCVICIFCKIKFFQWFTRKRKVFWTNVSYISLLIK